MTASRSFKRTQEHAWIGGVASGLAYTLGWYTWAVRLLWVLAVVFLGIGPLIYVLLWLLVPRWAADPMDYVQVTEDTHTPDNL
jgi:phage shock protein PspC (stress-responsive transcriptional regulator)